MSKASKLTSKGSRKASVMEQDGPPSIDREARIICPFPEWNDEYVNILVKKLNSASEQVDQQPPPSAKKAPPSARGAKPAQQQQQDDGGFDTSILYV
jgi:hypothetical protein